MKKELTHLLGGFLIISSFFNSDMGLLPVMNIIPILLVSFGVENEKENVQYIGLISMTLLSSFLIIPAGLGNTTFMLLFIISFVLPLMVYWKVVLSFDLHFDLKASVLGMVYFIFTVITFYALIYLLNINEFILAAENTGPMALAFSATVILVLLPFYMSVNR
ncbi:MAG: hypothetical protein ACQEQM_05285 [Thermoplasmatota archaeon]